MGTLLAQCTALFSGHTGLFGVFFLGGVVGGFTHCLGMCGPMAASQSMACRAACSGSCGKAQRISQVMGLPYHLGRFTGYGALGFLAALLSKQIAAAPYWPRLSAAMLAIAGVMFLASSIPGCAHTLIQFSSKFAYVRGVLLGFMPCGLIYAALMMAATLAKPFLGMFAMWLFVLGTIPALVVASVGAELLTKKWKRTTAYAGRALMAFNGLSLLVMAGNLVR
jgi:sulfite exporter TauE/SafE